MKKYSLTHYYFRAFRRTSQFFHRVKISLFPSIYTETVSNTRIIKPGSFPGLHFVAFSNSSELFKNSPYDPTIVYMVHPKGKLYNTVLSGTSKKGKFNFNCFKILDLVSKYPRVELSYFTHYVSGYKKYLDEDNLIHCSDITGLYNIFIAPEPQLTYRIQAFQRFPWIKWELHFADNSPTGRLRLKYKLAFLSALDNGESAVESIWKYFQAIEVPLEKALIKKTAQVQTNDITSEYFLLDRAYFDKTRTEFSPEIISLYQNFVRKHMPYYERSKEEFDIMSSVNKLYMKQTADVETRLNLLSHKKRGWLEEYTIISNGSVHFPEILDSVGAFVVHVILPEILVQFPHCNKHDQLTALTQALKVMTLRLLTSRFDFKKLLAISKEWHRLRNTIEAQIITYIPSNEWPALCESAIAPNGYKMVCLTSAQALKQEGEKLKHCVSSYVRECLACETHIISIKNNSGESSSTLEVRVDLNDMVEKTPVVVQHKSVRNSSPGFQDKLAVEWLLGQIEHKKIKLNKTEIAAHKKKVNTTRYSLESFIGFDPNNLPIKQKAFNLYHPIFIRDNSITHPNMLLTPNRIKEFISTFLDHEPSRTVRR